jgi:hypothetical protein
MLYADPGSGVLIWQLMLAIFFGGAFYFSRLRHWVAARLHPEHSITQDENKGHHSSSISENE